MSEISLRARNENEPAFKEVDIRKFTTKIKVYWCDCDAAGIAYYGNFYRFFEMAEEDLYSSLGRPRPTIYFGINVGFPRVETWARYFKPARMGDILEITTWIERRTTRSMQFNFEVRREGETDLVAKAHYTVVSIDRLHFKPIPLPAELLDLLKDYLPPITERAKPAAGHEHAHS